MHATNSHIDGTDRRPGPAFRLIKWAAIAACCAVLALAVGFGIFLLSIPTQEVILQRNADGIVVLTGGASRIEDAIELLASGRGRRLLISGVHRQTSER